MELIEQVINRQNMMRAFKQVRQNKGSAGVDRMPVKELYDYLTKNRESIEQSLLNGIYLATTHFGGRNTQKQRKGSPAGCTYRGRPDASTSRRAGAGQPVRNGF